MEHPKAHDLAEDLSVPVVVVNGMLERLWVWAGENEPTGHVPSSARSLSRVMGWRDFRLQFEGMASDDDMVAALVRNRWLDEYDGALAIHDWAEHTTDTTHRKVARARALFADGTIPKTSGLNGSRKAKGDPSEKEVVEAFYSERFGVVFSAGAAHPLRVPPPWPSRGPAVAVDANPPADGRLRRVATEGARRDHGVAGPRPHQDHDQNQNPDEDATPASSGAARIDESDGANGNDEEEDFSSSSVGRGAGPATPGLDDVNESKLRSLLTGERTDSSAIELLVSAGATRSHAQVYVESYTTARVFEAVALILRHVESGDRSKKSFIARTEAALRHSRPSEMRPGSSTEMIALIQRQRIAAARAAACETAPISKHVDRILADAKRTENRK